MLIAVLTSDGRMYASHGRTPNTIDGVPAGARIVSIFVDGRVERADIEATGESIVISLPAIRRIRNQQLAA